MYISLLPNLCCTRLVTGENMLCEPKLLELSVAIHSTDDRSWWWAGVASSAQARRMLSQHIPSSLLGTFCRCNCICWGLKRWALSMPQFFLAEILRIVAVSIDKIPLLLALFPWGVVSLQQCSSSRSALFTAEKYWYSWRLEHSTRSFCTAPYHKRR